MSDKSKTQPELTSELTELHWQIAQSGALEAERERAETVLWECQRRHRSFVRNSQCIAFQANLCSAPVLFDGDVEALTGYTEDELMSGKTAWDRLILPDDLLRIQESMEKVRSVPHYATEREYRIVCKDGNEKWVHDFIQNICDDSGQPVSVQGTIYDITEQKLAEEALKESEEKFRTLANQLPNMIFINKMGRVVYANRSAEELMGYRREEYYHPDFDFLDLIAPEYKEAAQSNLREHVDGEEVEPYECALVTKDGKRIEAIIATRLVRYEGTEAILGIVTDITARKQTEVEFQKRTAQLEALREVGMGLATELKLDELLDSIVSLAVELAGGTSGGLYLYRPERDVLEWVHKVGHHLAPIGSVLHCGEELPGRVWETGKSLIVHNLQNWAGQTPAYGDHRWMAVIGIPVCWGKEFLGVLNVLADTPYSFSAGEAELLGLFATQAAVAIKNAQLFEQVRARSRYLEVLQKVNATLRSTLPLAEVLEIIAQGAGETLDYVGTLILIPDVAHEQLTMGAVWGRRFIDAASRLTGSALDNFSLPLTAKENPIVHAYRVGELQAWSQVPERIVVGVEPTISPRLARALERVMGAMGAACLPLPAGGQVAGVLVVFSQREQLADEERDMLLGLADQAGLAIENARLFESEQEQRLLAETLREVASIVNTSLDRGQVLDLILEQLSRVMDCDNASVMLLTDGLLEIVAHRGFCPEERDLGQVRVEEFAHLQEVIRTRQPSIIPDTRADARWKRREVGRDIRCWLGAPLVVQDRVIGILNLGKAGIGFYTQRDADLVVTFASQAAVAIENARLYEQAQQEIAERGRAEEALRESEEMYKMLVQTSPDAITATDLEGRITYVSQRTLALHGFEHEQELLGENAFSFIAPKDRERARANLRKTLEDGRVSNARYTLLRKDGTRFDGEMNAALIKDVLGKPRAFIASTRDITDRRHLEQQIEERRLYLESVLACAPDAIVALDAEHRVLEWNQGAEDLFGYLAEEARGRNIDDLIAATAAEAYSEATLFTRQVLGGGTVFPTETIRYRKDGTPVNVIVAGAPILVQDELVGVVAVYTDITKRVRAERLLQTLNLVALAVQRALTPEEIFSTAGEELKKLGFSCAVLLAADSQRTLCPAYFSYEPNAVKAAEKLLGVKAESFSIAIEAVDVFRKAMWERETVYVEGHDGLRQILPRAVGKLARQVVRTLKIPKSIMAPLIVEDEAIGLLSVQSDDLLPDDVPTITAFAQMMSAAWRKAQLVRDLETSLKELQQTQTQLFQAQKLEALGQLAGGIAHDFNNFLTVLHLSTRMLERQLRPEDPAWQQVQRIQKAGQRATNLTKQLLSFSRREVIEPQVLDLNDLVSEMSKLLQRIIGEDVQLRMVLADDLWLVEMDPTQVDQVVMNLAVNSRDAMPDGGTLTLETANVVLDEAYAVRQVDVQPGEYVMLAISDTGVGMDDKVKARIFEPFFTTKERGKGTGLGLSTVFGIVKQNEGSIGVYSEIGQGTTFRIYLPRAELGRLQAPSRLTTVSTWQGTETILVVEDKADVRNLTAETLRGHGYEALIAENGPEALQISRTHSGPIHLLLTDMVMPQMGGIELAEQLRLQRPEMQVLYMSGFADRSHIKQTISYPGATFLAKPFTVESLTEKVRAVLEGGQ